MTQEKVRIVHDCNQKDQISDIKKKVDDICTCVPVMKREIDDMAHTIEGNGQKGLREVAIRLSENVDTLNNRLDDSAKDRLDLHVSLANLDKSIVEIKTIYVEQQKSEQRRQWVIYIVIVLLLGVGGLLFQNNIARKNSFDRAEKDRLELYNSINTLKHDVETLNEEIKNER